MDVIHIIDRGRAVQQVFITRLPEYGDLRVRIGDNDQHLEESMLYSGLPIYNVTYIYR